VDARLVLHYFGSKQELFTASVELPMEPAEVIAIVFGSGPDQVPAKAARLLVSLIDDPDGRRPFIALLRAAVSEPVAAELIRRVLTERILLPMARQIGGTRPELRASLVASQLVGILLVRHIVGIEPLAAATRDELIAALEPVFAHYLRGDWLP
jgi:AcrR family transcriptional regulator